ncbi:MAG: hypothetical protein FWE48_07500, partial [Coriobacteriia bacterium]|nr:hypothetical protein [Coriobacteriia bacterium]
MSFINRAFASMTRNLGKTILLLLIVFVLGCVISGAISVRQAVHNTETNVMASLPSVVMVEPDYERMEEVSTRTGEWPEMDMLTIDILTEIGALPYVKNYDFMIEASLLSTTMERYVPEGSEMMYDTGMGENFEHFALRGMQSATPIDIEEGIIEIASGRMFT